MKPEPQIPKIPITNKEFKYVPSYMTDLAKKFKEIRDSNMLETTKEVKDVGEV